MVQASTHGDISVSMHGWAILFGHRKIVTLHQLPSPHLPPNGHHLHLSLCRTQESHVMPLVELPKCLRDMNGMLPYRDCPWWPDLMLALVIAPPVCGTG
jgi:hypothetical protein